MSIKTIQLERQFAYAGLTLPDPNPALTPDQVREIYAAAYPELATSSVDGPESRNGAMVFTFKRSAGMKG